MVKTITDKIDYVESEEQTKMTKLKNTSFHSTLDNLENESVWIL